MKAYSTDKHYKEQIPDFVNICKIICLSQTAQINYAQRYMDICGTNV